MNVNFKQLAKVFTCVLPMLVAVPASASDASDASDIQATVVKWVANINKGDFKAVAAECAAHASIVDGFPPYAWQTCPSWLSDYQANNKLIHAPLGTLSMGKPIYSELHGAHAYVIYPVTFADTQDGKQVVYKGTMTVVLQKSKGRWLISAQASAWGVNTL